jgi:hypothetical protein
VVNVVSGRDHVGASCSERQLNGEGLTSHYNSREVPSLWLHVHSAVLPILKKGNIFFGFFLTCIYGSCGFFFTNQVIMLQAFNHEVHGSNLSGDINYTD